MTNRQQRRSAEKKPPQADAVPFAQAAIEYCGGPAQFADRYLVASLAGVTKLSFGEFTFPNDGVRVNSVIAMTDDDAVGLATTILSQVQAKREPKA